MTTERFAIHNRVAQLREHRDVCFRDARDEMRCDMNDPDIRAAFDVADYLMSRASDRAAHDPAFAQSFIAALETHFENALEPLLNARATTVPRFNK